jgi:hypothetical protein
MFKDSAAFCRLLRNFLLTVLEYLTVRILRFAHYCCQLGGHTVRRVSFTCTYRTVMVSTYVTCLFVYSNMCMYACAFKMLMLDNKCLHDACIQFLRCRYKCISVPQSGITTAICGHGTAPFRGTRLVHMLITYICVIPCSANAPVRAQLSSCE